MSSIEERLARDIAAVTGGVIVTESNLRDARKAVDERIESKRRRDRRRTVGIAAAAAVAVTVIGVALFQTVGGDDDTSPAGPVAPVPSEDPDASYLIGSPPTSQLLEGVWRVDNGGTLVQFEDDGTVVFDYYGTLFSDPVTTGTYEIDGDLISVTTTADAEAECIGQSMAFRASLPEPGAVRFVRTEEASVVSCTRVPPGGGALEQLLPTGPTMMGFQTPRRGWEPLTDQNSLVGFFLAEGGGYALEMDRGGAYFVADESGEPIDRGQWSLRGSELTLTSSAQSTECSAGDQLVLSGVEQVNPGTTILRGTVAQNACGAAWTPPTWILIPNESTG